MRFLGAAWRGEVPNKTIGGVRQHNGLVLHIESGTELGTDAWFHNPKAQASAHFGNAKDDRPLDQWVDTDDKAWAEAAGNPYWCSIENEGQSGDSLTVAQLEKVAQLYAWGHKTYGWPFQSTDDVNVPGLGWHGMGGTAWGGHVNCPGEPIKQQRPLILSRALAIVSATTPIGDHHVQPFDIPDAVDAKDGRVLGASGAVYAFHGAYLGGANAQPYFVNRKADHFGDLNAQEIAAGKQYVIVDTASPPERYAYPE